MSDIEAVNLAGVLSKTMLEQPIKRAVDIVLSNDSIAQRYQNAVHNRFKLDSIIDKEKSRQNLLEEVTTGEDPIAAYYMWLELRKRKMHPDVVNTAYVKYGDLFKYIEEEK